VLRDGAAAQYGSDAIAGVINIVLKDQVGVLDAVATSGITGAGDGLTTRVGANYGVAVGERGVLSITGEFVQRGETNRAEPWQGPFFPGLENEDGVDYDQTTEMLEENGLSREDVRMRVGQSKASVGHLFLNGRLPLEGVELYTFGGATYREGDAAGFYRRPLDVDRIDPDFYPIGFLPRIHPTIVDWSLGLGGRTEIEGWKLDLSANHGGNLFLWEVRDSVNASLGAEAGTTFDAGGLGFLQTNVNADVVRGLDVAWVEKLSLVTGAELRVENFRQMAGEEASWAQGDETVPGDPPQPKVPGSQVFPGYQADTSEYRNSVGAYVGLESELTERILVDVAGRFEHYSDFGNTLTGKVAGRVELSDRLSLRAAVSNGFRAPSLHQIWFTAVSTQFEVVNGVQQAKQALLANNASQIASDFGIPALEEETSINISAGITAQPIPGLSITADAYRIDIQDRILYGSRLSSNIDDYTDPDLRAATARVAELLPDSVSQVEFFVNAADTSTMGLDVVAEYKLPVAEGVLGLTGAFNLTDNEVEDFHIPERLGVALGIEDKPEAARRLLFSDQERNRIEDLLPRQRATLGATYGRGPWNAVTRARYYGSSRYVGYAEDGSENESYSPKVLFDLELGHAFGNGLSVAIGAENLLNTYPDETEKEANRYYEQFIYRPDQFGMNGGFYYLRLNYVQ
jgi:iron complex outermembrane receptor protein